MTVASVITDTIWKVISPLLQVPRFRNRFERFISEAQHQIGIGGAGTVTRSGEHVVLQLLTDNCDSKANRSLFVLDVGSNEGQFCEMLLRGLGVRSVSIHCFEPSVKTFALLNKNLGERSEVRLNNFGLGHARGQMELFYDVQGSGLASLTKRQLDHLGIDFGQSEFVRIETLDQYCCSAGIEVIDLLKIDVEGHELDVLKGGRGLIQRGGVRMITFEFGGCNIDTRTYFRDYWELFQELGFVSFHRIMPSGALLKIDGYSERLEQFVTTNYLVVLDQKIVISK